MTPKQRLHAFVNDLPDDASTALAAQQTMEVAKYLRSMDDFENDRVFDHEDVMAEFEALADRIDKSADRVASLLKRHDRNGVDVPLRQLVFELLEASPQNLSAEQLLYEIQLLDRRGKPADEESLCRELGMTREELFDEDSDDEGPVEPPMVVESQIRLPRVDRSH